MQKWEYMIIMYDAVYFKNHIIKTKQGEEIIKLKKGQSLLDYIFEAGEKGWDLCSVDKDRYFLKRPIEE